MSSRLRACLATLLFCAVAFAAGLSTAPQLHDWLHGSDAQHECAATLISSGNVDHAASVPVWTAPEALATDHVFVAARVQVIARRSGSILEHAPPANS